MKLGRGIGAVLGVEQRVGERVGFSEILRAPEDAGDRMIGAERADRRAEIAQIVVPDADAEKPAIVLHHVDAGAPVRRVDHEMHRSVAGKHASQRAEARVRVAQMVKHAGAHDLVERLAQLADALDREPAEAQVPQIVFSLKFARVAQARFADVDCGHLRVGLAQRVAGGLRRSAARDQNFRLWRGFASGQSNRFCARRRCGSR